MPDAAGDAVLGLYRALGRAASPILPLLLSSRAARGKEDRARLDERFGRATASRPAGRLVWVHAASVGETNAVIPLVEKIVAAGLSVVFTSVTVSSAGIAAARLPEGAIHQFAPLDVSACIKRFLGHWRPDLALFVESELWPTTIVSLSNAAIPQVLVNARLSERSFRGWRRFDRVARSVFGRIPLCLAQTEQDASRYTALGAPHVTVTGNLKFDVPPPHADEVTLAAFRSNIAGRPVWVAASTHEGEEMAVAEAHLMLKDRVPGLLTIIVPRHPPRGAAIRAALSASGPVIAQRSRDEPVDDTTDLYLADTFGELGLFYRAAPIAFLGGSLVPHGGQNPIEPVRLGCAVLHGPHVHNFADIYTAIDGADASASVADAPALAAELENLLTDPATRQRRAEVEAEALKPFSGALTATMTALAPYIEEARA